MKEETLITFNKVFFLAFTFLENVSFPDDLEESFCQGLIKEHSMLQADHTVPEETCFMRGEEMDCELFLILPAFFV